MLAFLQVWADELLVSLHNCFSQFCFSTCLWALESIILHAPFCLTLYDAKITMAKSVFPSLSMALQVFLSAPLFSTPPGHSLLSEFFDLLSFPLLHSLSVHLSLHGRVVINPYFIAEGFLSHCGADSSPRSKALLGPNPILSPSISASIWTWLLR